MSARRQTPRWVLGGLTLVALTGCFSLPWERTGNQGGSSVIQAVSKITANNLGGMNPDDIQILADLATQISRADLPLVTDEQAQAVVDFIGANGITTVQSIQTLIAQAQQNPGSVVIPDSVREVIEAILANPDAYIRAIDQYQI
ncbi:MAG: hypothetical protein KA383_13440 [Phycisphaerae bacterium]|nr:hypothetical protein [Phycisphaerae bacterium]